MSSAAQIAANRANAAHSTGPRTPEGMKTSSANATRHGLTGTFHLLPGENPEDYAALLRAYESEFHPATPHEEFLVSQLAQSRWKLDRIERLQAEAVNQMLAATGPAQSPDASIVTALSQPGAVYDRLQRYAAQAERSYHRAHRELTQLRRQLARDRSTALNARLNHILAAPLPDSPLFPAYRNALQNEANPDRPLPAEFHPPHPEAPLPDAAASRNHRP